MKQIAVLGPKGTYSDIACKEYLRKENIDINIKYCNSILNTALAVDNDTIAILPFENTLDGFVIESMDQIINNKLNIIKQLKLDIDFACITNNKDISKVEFCYAQFKAQGQCLGFLSKYNFNIITTQSNIESLNSLLASNESYCAIVPMHAIKDLKFNTILEHVADSNMNETRFFIVEKEKHLNNKMGVASLIIESMDDYSGLLYDILGVFHSKKINLNAIMSRPMKTEVGKYKFYFECQIDGDKYDALIDIINILHDGYNVNVDILGIYNDIKDGD